MRFSDFASRIDDETLQDLLGPDVVRLLSLLDSSLVSPTRLRQVLFELKEPIDLLLSPSDRAKLVDVLRPRDAEILAQILRLDTRQDVYAALKRLKIQHGSQREKALADFFEVGLPPVEELIQRPEIAQVTSNYALFPHQRVAAKKVKERLLRLPYRTILHMPTGAGKTRTAMYAIAEHLRENEPSVVIWLAFSEELCEQAVAEFEKAWGFLGNRNVSLFCYWGNKKLAVDKLGDGLVIAGLSKLYSSIHRSLSTISVLGGRVSLVVIDEAHSAIADTYKLLLNALVAPHPKTALLGLTATPGRTWNDIEADRELAQFFGKQKVTLEVEGYSNPIDYLVDQGYLARATFRSLLHAGGLNLSAADLKQLRDNLDIPDAILQRLAADEQRNLKIILEIEALAKTHKRLLVFAATVEHSNLIAAVLLARGLKAHSLTAKTSSANRQRIIESYKDSSDEVKVICNFGVLTTGFDAPRTSAAVIARPTKSLVLYSQMVGRIIRGARAGGNETAEIVTVVDHELPGFGSISASFANWEDVWSN